MDDDDSMMVATRCAALLQVASGGDIRLFARISP